MMKTFVSRDPAVRGRLHNGPPRRRHGFPVSFFPLAELLRVSQPVLEAKEYDDALEPKRFLLVRTKRAVSIFVLGIGFQSLGDAIDRIARAAALLAGEPHRRLHPGQPCHSLHGQRAASFGLLSSFGMMGGAAGPLLGGVSVLIDIRTVFFFDGLMSAGSAGLFGGACAERNKELGTTINLANRTRGADCSRGRARLRPSRRLRSSHRSRLGRSLALFLHLPFLGNLFNRHIHQSIDPAARLQLQPLSSLHSISRLPPRVDLAVFPVRTSIQYGGDVAAQDPVPEEDWLNTSPRIVLQSHSGCGTR